MHTHTHVRRQVSRIPFESTWKRFVAHCAMCFVVHITASCSFSMLCFYISLIKNAHSRRRKPQKFPIPYNFTHFLIWIIWIYAQHLPSFESVVFCKYWPLGRSSMKIMNWCFHVGFDFGSFRFFLSRLDHLNRWKSRRIPKNTRRKHRSHQSYLLE